MKKKNKTIVKDLIYRKHYIKYELKKLILKSIIQNKSSHPLIRYHAKFKLNLITLRSNICKQNNTCIVTGRNGGVFKFLNISRHAIKQLNNNGLISNVKSRAW